MPKERKSQPNASDSGLRIELSRARSTGDKAPWRYDGNVSTAGDVIVVSAVVESDGAVEVTCGDAALRERVRLLLRASYKQSIQEGLRAPPRKIVRWREDQV